MSSICGGDFLSFYTPGIRVSTPGIFLYIYICLYLYIIYISIYLHKNNIAIHIFIYYLYVYINRKKLYISNGCRQSTPLNIAAGDTARRFLLMNG